jgi:hypothetical protein
MICTIKKLWQIILYGKFEEQKEVKIDVPVEIIVK